MTRRVVIVQARMTSRRFPGKSMADLCGKPVVQHVLERCLEIGADEVVLAVPDDAASEPMTVVAAELACAVWLGPEDDVLARYAGAAGHFEADVVLRITADCPMLDPAVCRKVLGACTETPFDYVANCWPRRSFPKGEDCEAFTIGALREADAKALTDHDREHVTSPWMRHQDWAQVGFIRDIDGSMINRCIDTPEDLERLRRLMEFAQWQ